MAIGKHKQPRRIDATPRSGFSAAAAGDGTAFSAPPALPTLPVPSGLTLSASLTYSAVTPGASITASWTNLTSYDQESYLVQIATDAAFASLVGTYATAPNQAATTIDGLRTATLYYVRVAAIVGNRQSDWSPSASVTTPSDTTAPAPVTSAMAAFTAAGDLVVTWTNPTSANLRDVAVYVYNGANTVELRRAFVAGQLFVYTAAMNLADTSGAGDPHLNVYLNARSWGSVFSTTVSLSATKAPPSTPSGLTSSWAGDAGLAGADCVVRWTAQDGAVRYRLTIDGVARELDAATYSYTLAANTGDHASIPDPSLALSLLAIDALGQVSAAATATAANARPPATALLVAPGFSLIAVSITPSLAADRKDYRIRVVKDGATVAQLRASDHMTTIDVSPYGSGSYQVGVSVADVFEQVSAETLSSAVALDPLTIADLRVDAGYDDDITTDQATLNTLKDALLASGGVYYP